MLWQASAGFYKQGLIKLLCICISAYFFSWWIFNLYSLFSVQKTSKNRWIIFCLLMQRLH